MTTLAGLRTLVRITLVDAAAWPDAAIDAWIGQGIRLYGAHFPLRLCHVVDLVTGVQSYPLPAGPGTVQVLAVVYLAGRGDAQLLKAVPFGSASWQPGEPVYALKGAAGADSAPAIVLGPLVRTGEQASIDTLGPHAVPVADGDPITVPSQHLEAITAYVEFAAHYALESAEAPAVDSSTIVLAQLGDEARKAWVRYKEVMDRLVWLAGPDLYTAPFICWGDTGL